MDTDKQLVFDKLFLKWALDLSAFSKAKRAKVGAILTRDNRPIASGWNGTPPTWDNLCERDDVTLPTVIHAEENIVYFCVDNNISMKGTTLYLTMSPCEACCARLFLRGISRIVYGTEYRRPEGLNLLKNHMKLDYIPLETLT